MVEVIPNLSSGAAREVPAFVDVVGYLYTELVDQVIERRLLVGHLPKYPRCKDRLHISKGEPVIANPTMPDIWEEYIAQKALDNGKVATDG